MLLLSITLATLAILSQSLPADSSPNKKPEQVVLGNVRNGLTNQSVAGSTVILQNTDHPSQIMGVQTAQDGTFAIRNVPGGKWHLWAEKAGFLPAHYIESSPNGKVPFLNLDGSTQPERQIELALLPKAVIAGRVFGRDNAELAEAQVQLQRLSFNNGLAAMSTISRVNSNDLGEYRFFNVPPGHYFVSAYYRDSASVIGLTQAVTKEFNSSGHYFDDYAVTYYPGVSDSTAAKAIVVKPASSLSNLDIRLVTGQAVSVSGEVSNIPLGSGDLSAILEPAGRVGLGPHQRFIIRTGTNSFEFKAVPPGRYLVKAESVSRETKLTASESVEVGQVPIEHLTLTMSLPITISGLVSMDNGDAVPEGTEIHAHGRASGFLALWRPAKNGKVESFAMSPDTYDSITVKGPESVYLKAIELNGREMIVDGFKLSGGNGGTIHFILSPTAGKVVGRTMHDSQHSARNPIVIAAPVSAGDRDTRAYEIKSIDDNGVFTISRVSPGKYKLLCFGDLNTAEELTPDLLDRLDLEGTEVEVRLNETKTVEVKVVDSTRSAL